MTKKSSKINYLQAYFYLVGITKPYKINIKKGNEHD